jgi:hypothetical protein
MKTTNAEPKYPIELANSDIFALSSFLKIRFVKARKITPIAVFGLIGTKCGKTDFNEDILYFQPAKTRHDMRIDKMELKITKLPKFSSKSLDWFRLIS